MKVIDTVKKQIIAYPTLYLQDTYEESEFEVLHHFFLTLGGSVSWANTKDPKQGGYLIQDSCCDDEDDEDADNKKYDKPYGEEVIEKDISHWFGQKMYYVKALKDMKDEYDIFNSMDVLEEDLHKYPKEEYSIKPSYNIRELDELMTKIAGEEPKEHIRHPYPNFNKQYSPFWREGCDYIQDDWREAAIKHMSHWLKYFNDPNKYANYYHNHTNLKTLKEFVKYIEKYKPGMSLQDLAPEYGIEFTGTSVEEFAQIRWDKNLKSNISFLEDTLKKLKV